MSSAVKDVMTTSVVAVGETATYKDIIIALRQRRVSACLVLGGAARVIGVVSEADLLVKEVGPLRMPSPGSVPPWWCRECRCGGQHNVMVATQRDFSDVFGTGSPAFTDGPYERVFGRQVGSGPAAVLCYWPGWKISPTISGASR